MFCFYQLVLWWLAVSTKHHFLNAAILAEDSHYDKELFEKYIDDFGKKYTKNTAEYSRKYENFLASLRRIRKKDENRMSVLNRTNAIYGLNKFSDLSPKEFKEIYLSSILMDKSEMQVRSAVQLGNFNANNLPKKLDWREKGIVTAINNQGQCGSCWAFSAVGTIESVWAKFSHELVQLSTQQVIDCSSDNYGCKGGYPNKAIGWIKDKHVKVVKSSIYSYRGKAGPCINESMSTFGVGVSQYFYYSCDGSCLHVETKDMLPHLHNYGPLSVIVDAISWQDYIGGIIQHHCSYDAGNHAVQIVGYDLSGDIPFWIVRNSWGKEFGEGGYLRIKIGDNLCGVANAYSGVMSVYNVSES